MRLGEEAIDKPVNGLVLSPEFPAVQDILVLLGDRLVVSREGGKTWSDWKSGWSVERGLSAVAAPQGIGTGSPLLVGLMGEGRVARI